MKEESAEDDGEGWTLISGRKVRSASLGGTELKVETVKEEMTVDVD